MGLLSGYLQRARIGKVRPFVHGDVLDLGCGRGAMKQAFGQQMRSYVGLERDPALVSELEDRYPDCRFYARDLDTDDLNLDDRFDVVLMIALAEHLFNQRHVFAQVASVLKDDGTVVLTTPTPFGNDIVHLLGARLGLFAQSAVDDHIVIYNRRRLGILAREVGLRVDRYATFQLGCNQVAVLRKAECCERAPAGGHARVATPVPELA